MDFKEKLQYSLNNKFLTLVVLGIIVVVNVLSLQLFLRFDWTENERYSVSDSTRSILNELDDTLSMTAYFSDDLPPQLVPVEQYVRDILGEYAAYGSGNVQVDFITVDDNDKQSEALAAGLVQAEMQVLENDSYQVRQAFFGMQMMYQGKSEAIPLIQESQLANFEYDLSSLILKLSQPKLSKVAFLQGHGEHGIIRSLAAPGQVNNNDYTILAEQLRKNYEVVEVNITQGDTLEGVDALIVAGAKRDLTKRDIFEIDQYLLSGGKALFLVDAIELIPGGVTVSPLDTNLKTLLSPLGLTVESNLLFDVLSEFANFQVAAGRTFIVQYPPFIRLVKDNLSSHPVVQKVGALVVRFVSSITLNEVEGLTYDAFLNTSPGAWLQAGPTFQTDPNNIPAANPADGGSQTLGVIVTGNLPRISPEESAPALEEWFENEEAQFELRPSTANDSRSNDEVIIESQEESTVVLISDSDFVADQALSSDPTPVVIVQNIIDYLALGEELINIRSKSLGAAPLDQLESTEKSILKFFGILFVPIILSFYGFFRLWMRKKEEKFLHL